MEPEYRVTDDTIEITGIDLTSWRHKNSVYLGSFYVKELREDKGAMLADRVAGDKLFINYRDSIHEKAIGWKTPLVELVTSFMKVAYLVSRGVIYQPFEDPDNFLYNVNKHRLQVVGRYDTTLKYVDETYLDWVMEFIGFTISSERPDQFGYLTHQEYYNNMDKDHKELYKGYLQCKDLQELITYTLEPSVIEVLEEYVPINRLPIDNKPTIREVLEKSVDEKEKLLKEEQEELAKQQAEHQKRIMLEQESKIATELPTKHKPKKVKKPVKSKGYSNKSKLYNQDKLDAYREQLGIPEDKHETNKKRRGSEVLPTVASIAFLIFAVGLAWKFYMWLM